MRVLSVAENTLFEQTLLNESPRLTGRGIVACVAVGLLVACGPNITADRIAGVNPTPRPDTENLFKEVEDSNVKIGLHVERKVFMASGTIFKLPKELFYSNKYDFFMVLTAGHLFSDSEERDSFVTFTQNGNWLGDFGNIDYRYRYVDDGVNQDVGVMVFRVPKKPAIDQGFASPVSAQNYTDEMFAQPQVGSNVVVGGYPDNTQNGATGKSVEFYPSVIVKPNLIQLLSAGPQANLAETDTNETMYLGGSGSPVWENIDGQSRIVGVLTHSKDGVGWFAFTANLGTLVPDLLHQALEEFDDEGK